MESIGESDVFLNFQEQLSRVAQLNRPVLLIGERGSGKELAARKLHYLSKRWEHQLLSLNCATLSSSIIESELFGYVKGAFTGANSDHKGLFEEANASTLFLDEIALLPMIAQGKILRLVEYGEFQRLGSSQTIEVDVRLIGATNLNLPKEVVEGKFRADLLDRLSFEVLYIPPLRTRGDDILILARFFAETINNELELFDSVKFAKHVEASLLSYVWPGNIRELKNVVERSVYRSSTATINELFIDPFVDPFSSKKSQVIPEEASKLTTNNSITENLKGLSELSNYKRARLNLERQYLLEALQKAQFKQKIAAELLGLSYDEFRALYRKHKTSLT